MGRRIFSDDLWELLHFFENDPMKDLRNSTEALKLHTDRIEKVITFPGPDPELEVGVLECAGRMISKQLTLVLHNTSNRTEVECFEGAMMEDVMGLAYNHHIIDSMHPKARFDEYMKG